MKYIIEKLQIQNFKYVTENNPILINTEKSNIVVLNGQNGYGKTTLFNAIELLLMGKIEHLAQTANKQSVTKVMEELANVLNKDIVIIGDLMSLKGERVTLQRKFQNDSNFESKIFWNEDEITQQKLNKNLEITQSLFNMGIYMSQSKSLAFLENKLKDRKTLVTDLVSTKEVDDKVALLKDISQILKEKIESKRNELNDKISAIASEIAILKNEITKSQEAYKETGDYIRLYEDEYVFDKKEIEVNMAYSPFVEPLNQIRSFLLDFEDYSKVIKNNRIDYTLNLSKKLYMGLYFSDLIQEINGNAEMVKNVEKCYLYRSSLSKEEWYVEKGLCQTIGVSDEDINDIQKKIEGYNTFITNLGNAESSLLDIQDSRANLIKKYRNGVAKGYTEKEKCPLCGAFYEEIDKVFEETEKTLLKSIEDSKVMKAQWVLQIATDFQKKFVPLVNAYIEKNESLYSNYMELKDCRELNTDELEKLLQRFNIRLEKFEGCKTADMGKFEEQYMIVIQKLKGLKQDVSKVLSEETIEVYKTIHSKYYKKEKPVHSAGDIEKKIAYIAQKYASDINRQLSELIDKKLNAERNAKQFSDLSAKVIKCISDLSKKYNDANKDYQSKLANAIRIPVLIYSGKIIQNFPLGLGIDTKVAKNQLTFESFEKKGTDVFNILSTGQLNGLAISIMLAIRKVYGEKCGLDILMIDDPLQTIDEISAISLADLLSNSGINQIIMSTHEDRKAKMLEYKFKQRNLKIKEINMKQVYLKSRGD